MPKIPGSNQRDAQRVFGKAWLLGGPAKRHHGMTTGKHRLIIPGHNPINPLTMGAIAKSAGLTLEQFRTLL